MNKAVIYCRGYVTLEIRGASIEHVLNELTIAGISFWNIKRIDILTIQIDVFSKSVDRVRSIILNAMCEITCQKKHGLCQDYRALWKRTVLILLIVLSVTAWIVLPKYIFFYEVSGNEAIPKAKILRELQELGVGFGTKGTDIRPSWIKNQMLNRLPELQWITITQNGCRAEIVVRERPCELDIKPKKGFANVIAAQDGIITNISVFAGQAQCKVGDTVHKGELLVSGIVDLERIYVLENADAEVFARTWRRKRICIPETYIFKGDCVKNYKQIWLTVGKRRIKIFGNSSNIVDSCDKMIKKSEWNLPGGLHLPLSLEMEHVRVYDRAIKKMNEETAARILTEKAVEDSKQNMRAGVILDMHHRCQVSDGRYILEADLECHEMIAQTVPAKWMNEDVIHD